MWMTSSTSYYSAGSWDVGSISNTPKAAQKSKKQVKTKKKNMLQVNIFNLKQESCHVSFTLCNTRAETIHRKPDCDSRPLQTSTDREVNCYFLHRSHPNHPSRVTTPQLYKRHSGTRNTKASRSIQGPKSALGNTLGFNNLQSTWPEGNVIKAWALPTLIPDAFPEAENTRTGAAPALMDQRGAITALDEPRQKQQALQLQANS